MQLQLHPVLLSDRERVYAAHIRQINQMTCNFAVIFPDRLIGANFRRPMEGGGSRLKQIEGGRGGPS